MTEFTITERTEPFTLEEVFDFIDDLPIGSLDMCELKSRIVDCVEETKNKAVDNFSKELSKYGTYDKTKGYILQKSVDGEYWYEGNFTSVELLCQACFELGKQGYESIRVIKVDKE